VTKRDTPNWGKNFCQNFRNLKAQLEPSKLGQNFCQNFCNLKAQLEPSKLGQKFLSKFLQPQSPIGTFQTGAISEG
jgi:hypothetical protein